MRVVLLVPCLFALKLAEAGYYKIRAPPPPPIPPASVHYSSHPPASHGSSSSSYVIPHRSPPLPHHPHHHHYAPHIPYHHHHSSRIPYLHKTSSREYHHRIPPYHPPPKLNNYHQWKTTFNTFRAPVIKETFNPPPSVSYHTPSYIKDDDKGPIHTIPAPNLGPADKPNGFQNEFSLHQQKQYPEADLVAVLKHGIHHVNVPHTPGYQVTEDPTLHSGQSDSPSYFAPDPDPSVPTVKVPTTTDPHSLPSNGQVPLDLYLQQQAEKETTAAVEQQQQSHATDTLTAQDLFNLLNYQPGGAVNLIPQTQLQQHILQPNVQFYNQGLLLPQYQADLALQQHQPQQQSQFQPQFQTFNYDERTQQGAFGSNSFPSSSMSIHINNHGDVHGQGDDLYESAGLLDNSVAGSEREEVFHNEIIQQPSVSERKIGEKRDEKSISKNQFVSSSTKYTSKTPQHKSAVSSSQMILDNLPKHQTIQENTNIENEPSKYEETRKKIEPNTKEKNEMKNLEILKPDDNVQLQKSIQIYESSSYGSTSGNKENDGELKDIYENSKGFQKGKKSGRGIVIGQVISENINPQSESDLGEIPFGARLRPKRY